MSPAAETAMTTARGDTRGATGGEDFSALRAAITAPAGVERLNDAGRAMLKRALVVQTRGEKRVPTGFSYDLEFILSHPVPAACAGCGRLWRKAGRYADDIRAPTLRNCSCFYCGGRQVALDQDAYADRLRTIHLYRTNGTPEPEDAPLQLTFKFLASEATPPGNNR